MHHASKRDHAQIPLISVITVCRNASSTLPQTIRSVADQNNSNFEYIVVDGDSTDGTKQIIEDSTAYIDHWISEPDRGIYDAMNKGARIAKGQYLAFLNADDRYFPDTIGIVAKYIEQTHADVYHGNMVKERTIDGQKYTREETPNPDMMPRGMGIFHPSSFVNTSLFRRLGGFDLRYTLASDYDLFLKLWLSRANFHYIDKPLSVFSLEGASNSGCRTYSEAIIIQERNKAGTSAATRRLLWKCRMKHFMRKVVFGAAKLLNMTSWIASKQLRKWQ